MHYSIAIEQGDLESLLNPHHLLYNVIGYLVFQFCHLIGISIRAVYLLQIINSLVGALGIYFLYRGFLELFRWKRTELTETKLKLGAFLLSLLIAFTAGYWFYSIETEVYIFAMFFVILGFFILTKSLTKNQLTSRTLITLGIIIAFACLFHQTHIFFLPAAIILLSFQEKSFWKRKLFYLLVPFITIVGLAYLIGAYLTGHLKSFDAFYSWITLYAHGGVWGHLKVLNIPASVSGLTRAFVLSSVIKDLVISKFLNFNIVILLLATMIFFLLLFINFVKLLLGFPAYFKIYYRLIIFYICWIIPYAIFAFWWEPYNQEFWIPVLVPVVGLLSIPYMMSHSPLSGKASGRRFVELSIIFSVIVLFVINFSGEIFPHSRIKNNERYQLCLKLKEAGIDSNDLVIMPNDTPLLYYSYFFDIKLRKLSFYLIGKEAKDVLEKEIKQARSQHNKIFISAAEIIPISLRAALGPAKFSQEEIKKFYQEKLPNLKPVFTYDYDKKKTKMYEFVYSD